QSRREAGKIFDSGSRTPIAITILVKDESDQHEIHYYDIGDYLSRKEKLKIIDGKKSIKEIDWQEIIPDKNNDWINQRDVSYLNYPAMEDDYFQNRAVGVSTNRDSWVYGFSKEAVKLNTHSMVKNFNAEI